MKILNFASSLMLMFGSFCVQAQFVEPPPEPTWPWHQFTEHVDDKTLSVTGKTMHVCDRGAMSGIHIDKNDLLCVEFGYVTNPNMYSSSIDVNQQIDPFGTRVCPSGYAMVGIHEKDNVIKCAPVYFGNFTSEFMDPKDNRTIRFGMHACPAGSYMAGWQKRYHNLICRRSM